MRYQSALRVMWASLWLMGCHGAGPCPHRLMASDEVATTADVKALGPPQRVAGATVVDEEWGIDGPAAVLYRGSLGPLKVEYWAANLKGQHITTNAEVALATAACPGDEVRFKLDRTIYELALWHDKANKRFIVTSGDPGKLRVLRVAP